MTQSLFDVAAFAMHTQHLMDASPDRARAVMVENNAYYMLVNMHIFLCNMAEFSDCHDSPIEPLIEQLAKEVNRIQEHKGARWLDDFVKVNTAPRD